MWYPVCCRDPLFQLRAQTTESDSSYVGSWKLSGSWFMYGSFQNYLSFGWEIFVVSFHSLSFILFICTIQCLSLFYQIAQKYCDNQNPIFEVFKSKEKNSRGIKWSIGHCNLCFFCFNFILVSRHTMWSIKKTFNTFVSLLIIIHYINAYKWKSDLFFFFVNDHWFFDHLHWFRVVFFSLSKFFNGLFLALFERNYKRKNCTFTCDIIESLFVPSWTNFIAWRATKPKSICISNHFFFFSLQSEFVFAWNSACHCLFSHNYSFILWPQKVS